MYKHRENDTIFFGAVWDFDLAFENDLRTYPINEKTDYLYRSGGSVTGKMKTFADNIIVHSAEGKAKLQEIWGKVREGRINEQHIFDFINQQEENLQESQRLNFMRWPVMNELVQKNPVVWGSYAAEVQNVRRFISERLLWMDRIIGYTYNPSGITDFSLDTSQSYQIYNLSGLPYTGDLINLPKGIYIVKQGRSSRKVQVR